MGSQLWMLLWSGTEVVVPGVRMEMAMLAVRGVRRGRRGRRWVRDVMLCFVALN